MVVSDITFTVPGLAKGKGRPRVCRWGTYTPKATKEYEEKIRSCIPIMDPIDGACKVHIVFYKEPPKSWSKKKKDCIGEPWTGRPDIDNLQKAVLDACNGYVYLDDAQVYKVTATKLYHHTSETYVRITFN